MVITDIKLREAFRTDIRPSMETERMLLERLNAVTVNTGSRRMSAGMAYSNRRTGVSGRGIVTAILAIAAVALLAVLLIKVIPSLRSPLANLPGPESDWEPAESLVTGETETDTRAVEETEESESLEGSGAPQKEESHGTAAEEDEYTYRLGALTFVMPEIWRDQGVEIVQEEHQLKAMYRGLQLCSIGEYPSSNLVGGDPIDYCAGLWYLDNETTAMLYVHNWVMKIRSGSAAVLYEGEGTMGTEYTSDEDLADILYTTTGKEYDLARLTERNNTAAYDYFLDAVMDSRNFASRVIAAGVSVDEESYTFSNDYFKFVLPETWRAAKSNVPPISGVNVIADNKDLTVMYRGLKLCSVSVEEDPYEDSDERNIMIGDTISGSHVVLHLENWVQDIIINGSIQYTDADNAVMYEYSSESDLQDILYMMTDYIFELSSIAEFKGKGNDAVGAVRSVRDAADAFINYILIPAVTVHTNDSWESDQREKDWTYEMEGCVFTVPEFWQDQGVTVEQEENLLTVRYRGLQLCTLQIMPAAEMTFYGDKEIIHCGSWNLEDDKIAALYVNNWALDICAYGRIKAKDGDGNDLEITSDEELAQLLYVITGQTVDIEKVKGQRFISNDEEVSAVIGAASTFAMTKLIQAVTVKDKNHKEYDPDALKSSYLKEFLKAEPRLPAGLSDRMEDYQIPEDLLHEMTDEELFLTVLDYPFYGEIEVPAGTEHSNQYWGDTLAQRFNGFRELTERENRSSRFLSMANRCHDYIVREYGWSAPRELLGILESIILYLDDNLDEGSTIW